MNMFGQGDKRASPFDAEAKRAEEEDLQIDPDFEKIVTELITDFLEDPEQDEHKFDCSHFSRDEKFCIKKVLGDFNLNWFVKNEKHTDFIVATRKPA